MTYRQIHHEMEVDFIAKIRTLLQAKYNWKKLEPGALAIDLKVLEIKDGSHKRRELQIRIPCTQFELQRQREIDVLDELRATLTPVLVMPWSKVSLSSLNPPGPQPGEYFIDKHCELRKFFFHDSAIMYDPDLPLLPRFKYPTHTDRFEIQYTVHETVDFIREFLKLLVTWSVHREWSRGPHPGDEREDYIPARWVCNLYSLRRWVCLNGVGLSLVTDFKEGLGRPKGAGWALYIKGGWLKVKALYKGLVEIEEMYCYGEYE